MTPPPDEALSGPGAVGAILLCTLFGANGVAIKVSLAGLGTFTAAGVRFTIAALAIALWARITNRPFRIAKNDRGPLLILSLLFTMQLSLFYLGLSKTLASRGSLVVNVVPFFVLIFAHFFIPGDRITLRKVLGMGLGFGGVALVLLNGSETGSGLYIGDWIIFLAAIIWGANAVFTKIVIHRFRSFQLVLYPMLCAAPIQFLEGWLWDDAMFFHLNAPIFISILYQSLITAAIGFVLWSSLLRRYGASTLHSFVFIMPIAGVTASRLILNEPITTALVIAVALVAAGIAIVNIKSRQAPPIFPVGRSY
jgi:drug/metabolite transporter (DMT)-like permease